MQVHLSSLWQGYLQSLILCMLVNDMDTVGSMSLNITGEQKEIYGLKRGNC